jgi:murein DD-endopeptidase MepM/ murein hydrolase activator NlpD
MRERTLAERASRAGRRLVWWVVGVAAVLLLGLVLWAGTEGPSARLDKPVAVVGKSTPTSLTIEAGRSGLARWEIRLRDDGGRSATLAEEDVPRSGLFGSSVRSRHVDVNIDSQAAGFSEGPATLEVWASDHRPLAGWGGPGLVFEQPITIDLTPPRLVVLGGQHHVRRGGSDAVLYQVDADAETSGVKIADFFFPGVPLAEAPAGSRLAIYAIPHDVGPESSPELVARDAAGNQATVRFPVQRKERKFPTETLEISDDFLNRKVPDLLRENQLPVPENLVDGYLVVNRDLRKRSEQRLKEITASSAPTALFQEAFLQQRGSQVRSAFAQDRTYRHGGAVIDQQRHLGYDLASTKQAPVVAANAGKVAYVGPLGIYGNTVVIDHGLGLATLYAHLSSSEVTAGQDVTRGQEIARTGETGLAGGDHLHFSILLRGVHVDPVEWWDAHWLRDHVQTPIAEARGGGTASVASQATAPQAAAPQPGAPDAAPPAGAPQAAAPQAALPAAAPRVAAP